MVLNDKDIKEFIGSSFARNFEYLKQISGHSLSANVKSSALLQVLMYWSKLRNIALRITETEVRLILPGLKSPKGRIFNIEGVVDIVREDNQVVMYDIKTHDSDDVRSHLSDYEHQINIYAYIWSVLRAQNLDEAAIIATSVPQSVKSAVASNDSDLLDKALSDWDPIVQIDIDQAKIDHEINDFGSIVDCIEDNYFPSPSVAELRADFGLSGRVFASAVCRNCDVRFSCPSYRIYSNINEIEDGQYFSQFLNDFGTELERFNFLSSELETYLY